MNATSTRFARGLVVAAALTGVASGGAGALAQDPPAPAEVERVFVPERAFDRVIERHPRGVVVRDQELDELLRRAGVRPAPVPEVAPPVAATIRHVRVRGGVVDGAALLDVEAEVTVLARGEVALLLPLRGVGLRRVAVDGGPARVLPDAAGVRVLLSGATAPDAPVVRRVTWQLGVRAEPGDERGAGLLTFPVPATASGKLELRVPGDVEVVLPSVVAGPARSQSQLSRGRPLVDDDGQASRGCVAWVQGVEGDATRLEGAFGGAASAGAGQVVVSWRPRRAASDVTPYVVADERSVFCVRQGVVTLEAVAALEVYRAGRDRFGLDLPPGFVLRSLAVEGEEVTQLQRGDRVELTLGAPRTGRFVVRLRAELTTGMGAGASTDRQDERQELVLQPLGFPDADRASGLVGVAQGEGTVVTFGAAQGLDRADAGELAANQAGGDTLLRVYRRLPAPGRLELAAEPQAPRVDLVMRAVVGLGEREVRALTIYQFRVLEGRVFRLDARVPGFAVETVQVREVRGGAAREPVHQLTTTDDGLVTVELQEALRRGDELFLNVQAVREEPQALAGRTIDVPRIGGAPATSTRGHIGFAPDEAYRLTGSELTGLTAIPAAELPRAGLDVAGLVLGYRVDAAAYAGKVHLTPRETRVSARYTTHHRVAERVVETDALIELEVEGAPITTLELLLPRGVGRLARIEAPDLKDDRELVGAAGDEGGGDEDGRERWRLTFEQRKSGALPLRVRFDTTVQADPDAAGPEVGPGADPKIELPRVSVADAFRERGALAVFSSDATELQAEAQGLRTIEVTDVPALPGSTFGGRPLFGFTHTGADHRLRLSVKRRDAASVLAAVVERVDLKTSAAPDGLSRHEAVFHVRHLEAQFFALRLPEGATLWSVVVGGQGVKPAERDGLKIVPMPSAAPGASRGVETVSVTYTLRRDAWGALGRADLLAPELLVDRDRPVPVLRTTWALALPDDYRVLEFDGNLRGADAEAARPLALGLWRGVREATFALGLLVLVLGIGASTSARTWLLAGLARSGGGTREAGQLVVAFASRRGVQLGCAAVVALCLAFFCLMTQTRRALDGAYSKSAERVATRIDDAIPDERWNEAASAGGAPPPAPPAASAPFPAELADEDLALLEQKGAAQGQERELRERLGELAAAKEETARSSRDERQRRRENAPQAPPPPPPTPAPVQAPRPARPQAQAKPDGRAAGRSQEELGARPVTGAEGGEQDGGFADELDAPAPDAESPMAVPMEPAPLLGATDDKPTSERNAAPGEATGGPSDDPAAPGLVQVEPSGKTVTVTSVSDDGSWGRVGLRSLVLDLPAVGRAAAFERPGGKGHLVVQLVRDDALTLGAGALALLGLLVGALVPGRGRASYLGLVLVTGAVATALPYVLEDARLTPLLNALVVGLLAAGPIHAARWLGAQAALARAATTFEGPRDEALRALSMLTGLLAVPCLGLTLLALFGRGSNEEALVYFGLTGGALVVASLGLALRTRWALVPTLVVGLGQAGVGALVLQDGVRHGPGVAVALVVAWIVLFAAAGLGALALLTRGGGARVAALLLGLLVLGASPARADEPAPKPAPGQPPRVYVPYDPANPDAKPGDVYVPEDVYLDLWRRAYPDQVVTPPTLPPAAHALGQVAYEGTLGPDGLTLSARVDVDVLAEGWTRCPLGLAGTGLREARVQGGKPGAKVRVAPAGGLELVAEGPGAYVVTLDLVVPQRDGGYVFAAVPALAATLRVRSTLADRRVVVGGARAQVEERAADGSLTVDASLGDAARVHLTTPGREVLSAGGASEAAATNHSVVWVRRGRVVVLAQVTFSITGAGREGFLFDVPPGFEVTSVQTDGLRAWRVDEQGRLELTLRRPTGSRAAVMVWGEQVVPPGLKRFRAPQLVPQGVSREAGVVGLCVEDGLRVRPVDAPSALRQVAAGAVQGLAGTLRAGAVERAYEFARRPAELELELVEEEVEVKADTEVRATILGDRMTLHAEIAYDVRRGKVHQLAVEVPDGFTLAQPPRGLDIREAPALSGQGPARTYHFGLATGLAGQARLVLDLERPLAGEPVVPFPDVRPLGVAWETTAVSIAAAQGLRVRPQQEPQGLQARDARSATRGRQAPAGTEWISAYQRQNGRVAGLATAALAVSRPAPRVTGSWTLHVRVERDVVRYTLRAVYGIADAGASTFHLLLPAGVVERVRVDAVNQREVRSEPAGEGVRRLTVELQSPAEDAYELGATWEEVLTGPRFSVPQVALDGVERQARRFVLVEAAADVPDKLEPAGVTGAVEPARASEAPVLPGPASDFAHAYRVGGGPDDAWSASFELKPRDVRLPPAARIPWADLTSVLTTDGVVRHRARYRVHNLRLQFLRLQLPAQAEVWSVFVAGAPRRLHHEAGLTLIPLPKGTDADLSFDVELIFATPLPGDFGFGAALRPEAPAVRTPDVQVERTSWSLFVPEAFECRGFAGNLKAATAVTSGVQALVEDVNELKKLVDLAENATGNTRFVAGANLRVQLARVEEQMQLCEALGASNSLAPVDRDVLTKNRQEVQRLASTLSQREQQVQQAGGGGQAADAQQVVVEGKSFDRLESGWYSNNEVAGAKNRTRWSGVAQGAQGPDQAPGADAWTLSIPEGQSLSLANAEVFSGDYAPQSELAPEEQQAQNNLNLQRAKRLLDNRGYEEAQEDLAKQQQAQVQQQAQTYGFRDEESAGEALEQLRRRVNTSQALFREGDKDNAGGLDYGTSFVAQAADGAPGHGRSEGLLSIQVPFETPGRAYHFATDTQEAPQLSFSVYPEGVGEQARRAGRGLVLLVLLLGLLRLGLLAPIAGRGAAQALLLLGAGVLAASVFVHVGGAVLALAAGLWGLRRGPGLLPPAAS